MVNTQTQSRFSQQMLYRQDSHSAPTLYLASKSRIDIPVPEDFTHAFVQIRVTGPGGDGVPAEVHILRNSGTYASLTTRTPCTAYRAHPGPPKNKPSSSAGRPTGGDDLLPGLFDKR